MNTECCSEIFSRLKKSMQEMFVASTTSLAGIVKEFGLFDFPLLFSNAKQADAMVDGPLGKMLSAKLADKGVIVLGFFDLGFRNVTNSKRPITKGEDLEGLKLRVIPNPVFLATFRTFKANPLPMPFAIVTMSGITPLNSSKITPAPGTTTPIGLSVIYKPMLIRRFRRII